MISSYEWTKKRLTHLVDQIGLIKNDNQNTAPGEIWSIKKLLALDYYISATHNIFKKNFKQWNYVDTHCGTGMIGFKNKPLKLEKFPGSPLIAALRHSITPFSNYYFYDIDNKNISILNQRLEKLRNPVGDNKYCLKVSSFADTAEEISKNHSWGNAYIIFIDPTGYAELKWNDMKKLLKIDKADIFITFMSYSFQLNLPHTKNNTTSEKTFNDVFGTSDWKNCTGQNDLLQLYLKQLKIYKKYVGVIPIYTTGQRKLYDLIFVSNNERGAGHIMDYTKGIMNAVTTELIDSAMKVVSNKAADLDQFADN